MNAIPEALPLEVVKTQMPSLPSPSLVAYPKMESETYNESNLLFLIIKEPDASCD